jgi:hypothetical protein
MSAVDAPARKAASPAPAKRRAYAVPPYRLLCYVIILLTGIIILFLSR